MREIAKTRTFRSGLLLVASGLAFSLANIMLARVLDVDQYAMLALLIAIIMLCTTIGMLGADGIVNRHLITPNIATFSRVFLTAGVTASGAAWLSTAIYEISGELAVLLAAIVVAFALCRFCGAFLQSRLNVVTSLILANSLNFLLLIVAVVSIILGLLDAGDVLVFTTLGQCAVAVCAVTYVGLRFRSIRSDYVYDWREALAYLFMLSNSVVLLQLDRLLVPQVLQLSDLAVLGILLAIVGPPFRLLDMALGYDLLPLLRRSRSHSERVKMLAGHSRIAISLILPSWVVIWYGAPWIQSTFLSSDYELSKSLILAALVAGTIKAFSGIAQACVTALASVRNLERIGVLGWASILIGSLAAWYGSRYGLPGVVYGVAIAWFLRLASAVLIVSGELRDTNPIVRESI